MHQLMNHPVRSVLTASLLGLLCCCQASLAPQCEKRPKPGANFGECAAVIGAYYSASSGACAPASGCECDAACREQVPFATLMECQSLCEGGDGPYRAP